MEIRTLVESNQLEPLPPNKLATHDSEEESEGHKSEEHHDDDSEPEYDQPYGAYEKNIPKGSKA